MVSRCESWQRVVGKMECANSERFVYLPAPRPEIDGDCAQKYHRAVARIIQCSLDKRDGVVSVRGKSSNLGRCSTDVDIPPLVFLLDCILIFVCQVEVP